MSAVQPNVAASGFCPTEEQQAILDASVRGESFGVFALAGTGKTTTLREIARRNPHKRILYLAFAKPTANEARGTFPRNVYVSTAHSLAYKAIGHRYQTRLERSRWTLRKAIGERFGDRIGAAYLSMVVETLTNFCASDAERVMARHVPTPSSASTANSVARLTQGVFDTMADPDDTLSISDDVYFKAWELSKPDLPYDIVLFDEAQDASPVMLAVLRRQRKSLQQIYVGDTSQAIYAFRRAVNALESLTLPTYPLTQSYRFGDQIARVANVILAAKDERLLLRGRPGHHDRICRMKIPDAMLARTNAGLFAEALKIGAQLEPGDRLAFMGGVEPVLASVLAAHGLWKATKTGDRRLLPTHKEFREFGKWDDLVDASETEAGGTYRPFVRLVDTHKDDLPGMCAKLRALAIADPGRARVIFSTLHGAKGLEWGRVAIAGDLMDFCVRDRKSGMVSFKMDEANLVYVGLTRAMHSLDISRCKESIAGSLLLRREIRGSVKPKLREVA